MAVVQTIRVRKFFIELRCAQHSYNGRKCVDLCPSILKQYFFANFDESFTQTMKTFKCLSIANHTQVYDIGKNLFRDSENIEGNK